MDDFSDSSDSQASPAPDPVDDLHGTEEEDEPANEEGDHTSEIVCPCVSPELFVSTKLVDRRS